MDITENADKTGREQQVLTEAQRAINRPIEPELDANRNSNLNWTLHDRERDKYDKTTKGRGQANGGDEDSDRNSKPGIEAGQVNSLFRDGVRQTNPTDRRH